MLDKSTFHLEDSTQLHSLALTHVRGEEYFQYVLWRGARGKKDGGLSLDSHFL